MIAFSDRLSLIKKRCVVSSADSGNATSISAWCVIFTVAPLAALVNFGRVLMLFDPDVGLTLS